MNFNPIMAITKTLSKPIADISGFFKAREEAKAMFSIELQKAKQRRYVAKIDAKTKSIKNAADSDTDYDQQVLKNRDNSLADEFLIVVWIGLFVAHFLPVTQPYMAIGWKAMGYTGSPWWFEFGMVGILVSTLGLMRLFKVWFRSGKTSLGTKKKVNLDSVLAVQGSTVRTEKLNDQK